MTVAVFRPADARLDAAVECVAELGLDPVADPMLAVEPTGRLPGTDADYVILTSRTGAELVADAAWDPGDGTVLCAIGAATAQALRERGYAVDVVPEEFSSAGLVEVLRDRVAGASVEVARSDHGSPVLLEGLREAGAAVHETILYELVRPPAAGESVTLAARGELAGALFTSSLTVEHFIEIARERGVEAEARAGLSTAVVGAIGEPTRETAESAGITVDVVPDSATFASLARAVHAALED